MRKLPKPIPRLSAKKLRALKGRAVFSTISSPKKAIKKCNPERQAKRKAGYRKLLSGKEYRRARDGALIRAEGQCEFFMGGFQRCSETYRLHAHHLRYPKTRPLAPSDLTMVCRWHHEYLESQKMHKQRMF